MSLQMFNKFSYSCCTFSKPEKRDMVYYSKISKDGKPLFIQLPKLKTINGIHWHDNRCYLDLELTKPIMDFFLNFEQNNIQTVAQNSQAWFGKEMPIDIIESNYLSIVKLSSKTSFVRFSIPVNEESMMANINVYNQFKEKVNPEDILPGSDVWVILSCKGLVVGKRNLCFEWSVEQIKFHTKAGNPYMFIEDEDEDLEIMENPFYDEHQFEKFLQQI